MHLSGPSAIEWIRTMPHPASLHFGNLRAEHNPPDTHVTALRIFFGNCAQLAAWAPSRENVDPPSRRNLNKVPSVSGSSAVSAED